MNAIAMRDGSIVEDSRLGRLIDFDDLSRNFPLRSVMGAMGRTSADEQAEPRSHEWPIAEDRMMDQGNEGSCTGFGAAHTILCDPNTSALAAAGIIDADYAEQVLYWNGQLWDDWAGGSYPDARPQMSGSSVRAVLMFAKQIGWAREIRWTFSIEEFLLGLSWKGPCDLGISWYEGMMDPDAEGIIRKTGKSVGGHSLCANRMDLERSLVGLVQSWGPDHGIRGCVWIPIADLESLLSENGEAAFLVQ